MEASGHPHNVAVAAALHTADKSRGMKRASAGARKLAAYRVSRAHSAPAPAREAAAKKSGHTAKHPGFKAVAARAAARQGVSVKEADREIAASSRRASPAAKRANPRLRRVGGM